MEPVLTTYLPAVTPLLLGLLTFVTAIANRRVVKASEEAKESAHEAAQATIQLNDTMVTTSEATVEKLNGIHTLVNSQMTEALNKIGRLERKLYAATGETDDSEPDVPRSRAQPVAKRPATKAAARRR